MVCLGHEQDGKEATDEVKRTRVRENGEEKMGGERKTKEGCVGEWCTVRKMWWRPDIVVR